MQTLTYTIGKDRRALVKDIQNFTIDFNDQGVKNWVQARQYERSMRQVFVNVNNDDDSPFDLTGCNIWFEGVLPDKTHKILDAKHAVILDAQNGQFRFDMPAQAFAVAGSYVQAFFRIVRDGQSITTLEFDLEVLADKVISGLIPSDYITPFEDLYDQLEQIVNNADGKLQDKLNEWNQKLQNLFDTLNKMGTDTQTLLQTLQNRIAELEEKIKQDGLFTQAEADAFKQSIQQELNEMRNLNGINVMDYGAVADGTTDNHDAILKAFDAAKSTKINHVFFPAGKYFTTNSNIEVENMTITGDGCLTTTIVTNEAEPIFTMKNNSLIEDISFYSDSTSKNIVLGIAKRNDDVAYQNITLKDLNFDSVETPAQQAGWTMRPIWLDLNNLGVWNITIKNCHMNWVEAGITVDTTNTGWMTGALMDNIVIKGYTKYGLGLISSNSTARQISHSTFSNFNIEAIHQVADDSAGYVISGNGNNFDNLHLFNDTATSGQASFHAIELRYFGGKDNDKDMPTFGYGATAMNTFKGGEVEGTIYDPDGIRDLQHFDHLNLQVVGNSGSLQMTTLNDPIYENLLSRQGMISNLIGDIQIDIPKDATMTSGADRFGQFIEIAMGNSNGSYDYLITEPASTIDALKGENYSIGLKFRDLSADQNYRGNKQQAYLQFNGKDVSQAPAYIFANPDIQGDLQEWTWIYSANPSFDSMTTFDGENRCKFFLYANSHIRIYGVFLCSGRVMDFSRVNDDNVMNTGLGQITGPLPNGVSLNEITAKMLRYSGTFYVGSNNRPADTPAEFGTDPYIIQVTPIGSTAGILRIIDVATNNFWMATVFDSKAHSWVKLHGDL
ncbi:BppU family phage baseplate upper protein [Limosilactobacillus pontis]|uniref:BppU family phage baseplate upper protein n=1 Tax=Limosilactobacillus pontis TaxID=35787 RepID=UPI002F264FD1